jgi:hypothetical protein
VGEGDAEEEPAGEGEAAGGVERHGRPGGEPESVVRGAGTGRPPCTHLMTRRFALPQQSERERERGLASYMHAWPMSKDNYRVSLLSQRTDLVIV